jgi:hypothetical protein
MVLARDPIGDGARSSAAWLQEKNGTIGDKRGRHARGFPGSRIGHNDDGA